MQFMQSQGPQWFTETLKHLNQIEYADCQVVGPCMVFWKSGHHGLGCVHANESQNHSKVILFDAHNDVSFLEEIGAQSLGADKENCII
jgi:hypothetical protein